MSIYIRVVSPWGGTENSANTSANNTFTGANNFTQPVGFADGTAALPSIKFTSDPDTGVYRVGANSIGLTVNGALLWTFGATNSTLAGGQILSPAGSGALPSFSFSGDPDTGVYSGGANALNFATSGTGRITLTTTGLNPVTNNAFTLGANGARYLQTYGGQISAGSGTVGAPGLGFADDQDTGIYNTANTLLFSTSGTLRATLNSTSLALTRRLDLPYTDSSGTPGNATIDQASGRVAIAAGASAMTLTNSLISATSIVIVQVESADATLGVLIPVPGAGSVVVTNRVGGVATNVTANTKFSFLVFNP